MSEESDFRLPNGRFAKGNPGGPGRPRTIEQVNELDQQVADAGPELIEVLLAAAKAGNLKAAEMLLNRIWPARRGRPVQVGTPEIREVRDLLTVGGAMTDAMLNGELTPDEGAAAASVLRSHARMVEMVDMEIRLRQLEKEFRDPQPPAKGPGRF